jgi:hypothetical protein
LERVIKIARASDLAKNKTLTNRGKVSGSEHARLAIPPSLATGGYGDACTTGAGFTMTTFGHASLSLREVNNLADYVSEEGNGGDGTAGASDAASALGSLTTPGAATIGDTDLPLRPATWDRRRGCNA